MADLLSLLRRRVPALAAVRADLLAVFAASTLVTFTGVWLGRTYYPQSARLGLRAPDPFMNAFVRWDGAYYRDIASLGYIHRPGQSPTHFMPGYPLAVRLVWAITGGSIEMAMVLTSHACLLAALVILAGYTSRRHGAAHPDARAGTIICIGFLPFGLFFHMGYTESQFLLVCIALLDLIDRGCHPVLVAGVAATGLITRLVGPALCIPVLLYAWYYRPGGWMAIGRVILCLIVCLSGIAAMMLYFEQKFGDPILFVRNRDALWRINRALPFEEKVLRLEVLEPVWGMFNPSSPAFWRRRLATPADLLTRLYLANRIAFVATLLLTWWGWRERLLNRYELSMIAFLVALPYWVNGYDNNMSSMARYMSVIAPIYPVAGILIGRTGLIARTLYIVGGSALMSIYSALFAQGHWLY